MDAGHPVLCLGAQKWEPLQFLTQNIVLNILLLNSLLLNE